MKIKHKFRENLFFKYKQVDCRDHIREYKRFRLWIVLLALPIMIIISPIMAIILWFKNYKSFLTYPNGKDGYETYNIYKKKVT